MIHQIVTTFLLFWLSLQVFSAFEAAINLQGWIVNKIEEVLVFLLD